MSFLTLLVSVLVHFLCMEMDWPSFAIVAHFLEGQSGEVCGPMSLPATTGLTRLRKLTQLDLSKYASQGTDIYFTIAMSNLIKFTSQQILVIETMTARQV